MLSHSKASHLQIRSFHKFFAFFFFFFQTIANFVTFLSFSRSFFRLITKSGNKSKKYNKLSNSIYPHSQATVRACAQVGSSRVWLPSSTRKAKLRSVPNHLSFCIYLLVEEQLICPFSPLLLLLRHPISITQDSVL